MTFAYLALGSNLGDRRATLDAAVRRLRAEPGLRVLGRPPRLRDGPGRRPARQRAVPQRRRRSRDGPAARRPSRHSCTASNSSSAASAPRRTPRARSTSTCSSTATGSRHAPTPWCRTRGCTSGRSCWCRCRDRARTRFTRPSARRCGNCSRGCRRPGTRAITRPKPARATGWALRRAARARHRFDQRHRPGHRQRVRPARGRRSSRHGRAAAAGGGMRTLAADLRDPADVDRLAADAWGFRGGLDILVCNAGADTPHRRRGRVAVRAEARRTARRRPEGDGAALPRHRRADEGPRPGA